MTEGDCREYSGCLEREQTVHQGVFFFFLELELELSLWNAYSPPHRHAVSDAHNVPWFSLQKYESFTYWSTGMQNKSVAICEAIPPSPSLGAHTLEDCQWPLKPLAVLGCYNRAEQMSTWSSTLLAWRVTESTQQLVFSLEMQRGQSAAVTNHRWGVAQGLRRWPYRHIWLLLLLLLC